MTIHSISEIRAYIESWKKEGLSIGFVPTMGYLHEGHKSLIEKAREQNHKVVVSIFVNPTQFGPNEDFESYPRDLQKDEQLCCDAGADLIFAPEASEMYFNDATTYISVQGLTDSLCGEKRPGHFNGVCTVVSKLFNIVSPHRTYFGEKDAQQLAVIKRMVRDLNINVEIIGCPIVREPDGLAKSSRNSYLLPTERAAAIILSKSLKAAKTAIENGERSGEKVKAIIREIITSEPLASIDYIELVDSNSIKSVEHIENSVLVAIAVYIGKTRLIDNFTFKF